MTSVDLGGADSSSYQPDNDVFGASARFTAARLSLSSSGQQPNGQAGSETLELLMLQEETGGSEPAAESTPDLGSLLQALQHLGSSAFNGQVGSGRTTASATSCPCAAPAASTTSNAASSGLAVNNGVIDTGAYTIAGSSKDDGSLTITDKATGHTTEVWGDPHVSVNGNEVADFQKKSLTVQLPDGTQVQVNPTATDGSGKAHIANATISRNGQSIAVNGNGGTFQNGVTVGAPSTTAASSAPNEGNNFRLLLGTDDNLHYLNGAALAANGHPVNLDEQMQGSEAHACGCGSSASESPALTVMNGQIDTGQYLISGGANDDGSLTVTDKATGKNFEVWGDPHVSDNGTNVGEFQTHNLNIKLPDGTSVQVTPTAQTNGTAHIASATVTRNGSAVTLTGNNGTFQNGVTTSAVGQAAPQQSSSGINLTFGKDDHLHYANGAQVVQTNGQQTDLDKAAQQQQQPSDNLSLGILELMMLLSRMGGQNHNPFGANNSSSDLLGQSLDRFIEQSIKKVITEEIQLELGKLGVHN